MKTAKPHTITEETTKNNSILAKIVENNFVESNPDYALLQYEGKYYSPKFGSDMIEHLLDDIAQALQRQREKHITEIEDLEVEHSKELERQHESDIQAFEEMIGPDNPMVGLQTIVAQNELRAELRKKLKEMK